MSSKILCSGIKVISGLCKSRKNRKQMFANTFCRLFGCALLFVMIAGIHVLQEIFAINMLTALKP